jgi:hypothetical protein
MSAFCKANNRLPVLDTTGQYLFAVDDVGARELLRRGQCRLIRRRGRDRVLQAVVGLRRDHELRLLGRGTALDRTRYSHNRDNQTNPPRVWTLTPQPTPAVFGAVIASVCVGKTLR